MTGTPSGGENTANNQSPEINDKMQLPKGGWCFVPDTL